MKKGKIVGLWILSIFFMLSAMVYFPSFSSLISVLIVALVIPFSKWQAILNKYIKGKLKLIVVIILALVTIFTAPNTEANVPDDTTSTITTEASTDSTVESTSETTTTSTTESTTAPTSEPTTAPTTEPATEPTAKPTTPPATTPTTPAAKPTTPPATESPHIHNYNPATCTAPKTCACGATEGTANGHSWKDATYTSPKTCTVCGTTEGTSLDVPGKENYHGHVYTGGDKSTKYHYEADCAGKYSHEITWEEVDRRGLEPCGTCVLK